MGFSAIQIILVFVWTFIVAIDQFDLLESLYQPIVSGAVIGAILGDLPTGLVVGGTYQLMTIGNMPVGGAQPPNAVIGGVMAVVFAIASGLDTTAAVGLAVPFALIGQYMVTLLFTVMSPMMSVADKMAETAQFFSFGTNDLTQMGCGFSRDDAGKFLGDYVKWGIYDYDPFQVLDTEGVGELVRIAVEKGRKTRSDITLGICGEHGGEPKTIAFCHQVGLNYVSCSPFRGPIARLAAAQAALTFLSK